MAIFVSLLILFMYCYFGKIASESSLGIANLLFQANWQALPVNLQKYFVIMITNAQAQLYYHGFGVAFLNLETFTKVIEVEIADSLFLECIFRSVLISVDQSSDYVLHDVQDVSIN